MVLGRRMINVIYLRIMNASDLTSLQRWFLASRPKTLTAAVSPVIVGSAIAYRLGPFRWGAAAVCLIVAVLLQIAANLINDVADFQRGTDTSKRLGPLRVTQAGLLTPRQVWMGAGITLGLAALGGLYLVILGGWPILIVGLASILASLAYSVGRYPLSDYGLGDLFVILFFGYVAVCGTVYLVSGTIPPIAWLAATGVGTLTNAILVVNNLRDIETDRESGRLNLLTVFGRRGGEIELAVMWMVGYLAPLGILAMRNISPTVLLPLLTLPLAIRLLRQIHATPPSPRFNTFLGQTAQLLFVYSLLLALGILVG
jgi:1,4-dihydroxy-2-naphthoate octaprenyltransferase